MKQHRTKIKNALSNEVPKWDDLDVWKGIEDNLPAKKKRRIGYYFFIASALLLLVTSYLSFKYINNSSNSLINSKIKTETTNKNTSSNEIQHNNTNTGIVSSAFSISQNIDSNKISKSDPRLNTLSKENRTTKHYKNNSKKIGSNSSKLVFEKISKHVPNINLKEDSEFTSSTQMIINKNISELVLTNQFIRKLENPKRHFSIRTPNFGIVKKTKSQVESKYTVDFIGGVYFTARTLSSSNYQNWINRKIEKETMLESTNFTLSLQRHFNNNFSVLIGLGYTQTIERFIHKDSIVSVSEVYSDTAFVYPSGIYVGGMVNKTTTNYKTIKSPNRFRYLSIPIGVNYNIHCSKSTIQIGGGINIDFWSRYSGYSLDLDNKTIHSSNELNNLYKRPIAISSIYFKTNYSFKFNNSFTGKIGFKSIFDINSSNTNKDIVQKYALYGGYIGLTYMIIR